MSELTFWLVHFLQYHTRNNDDHNSNNHHDNDDSNDDHNNHSDYHVRIKLYISLPDSFPKYPKVWVLFVTVRYFFLYLN